MVSSVPLIQQDSRIGSWRKCHGMLRMGWGLLRVEFGVLSTWMGEVGLHTVNPAPHRTGILTPR
jgi:hypothetical protein